MDEKAERRKMRKNFSKLGWALVLYLVIMNVAVMLVGIVDAVSQVVRAMISGDVLSEEGIVAISESVMNNGWGYFLAIGFGYWILRLWKGKAFCYGEIWTRGRPMRMGSFFALLCVFLSGQALFQVMALVMETILQFFGLSALASIEVASVNASTLSMFLYMGIGAPIAEEILFRGLILRTLLPHGKRFAIILSAFLFGIFHGNLVQTPYAFFVGLVLGYTAVEYSVGWAMVLHMFNNLVLGDMMSRLLSYLPGIFEDILFGFLLWGVAIAAIVIAVVKRDEIRAYISANPVNNRSIRAFFSAPGIIVLIVLMYLTIAASLLVQLL